ncbi:MAG: ribosome biogenesis GTPase RsgA, partial [Pseudomonadota bacterium]
MSQRKLTRRQQWRAQKIQQERTARAEKRERNLDRQLQSGELSSPQRGLVISRHRQHIEVQALEGKDTGRTHQCAVRTNLGNIVAGDQVVWRAGAEFSGVVESRLERANLLER